MTETPGAQHEWLQQMVGEWESEFESQMNPDAPSEKSMGRESVRSIGGLWVMGEGHGEMPDGEAAEMYITLGYDPRKQRFVGSWIGSMMSHMWVYDGELDPTGKILTLSAEGPSMNDPSQYGQFRDVIEFTSDGNRLLTSYSLGEDGNWTKFMHGIYRRVK